MFNGAIVVVLLAQIGFALFGSGVWLLASFLFSFFAGFNTLEASLPSMVSRIAPPQAKGLALGIYNTVQALGLASGGILGGVLAQRFWRRGRVCGCAASADSVCCSWPGAMAPLPSCA